METPSSSKRCQKPFFRQDQRAPPKVEVKSTSTRRSREVAPAAALRVFVQGNRLTSPCCKPQDCPSPPLADDLPPGGWERLGTPGLLGLALPSPPTRSPSDRSLTPSAIDGWNIFSTSSFCLLSSSGTNLVHKQMLISSRVEKVVTLR